MLKLFKRRKSYRETTFEAIHKKQIWLHNVLFNELYHEHPELWAWIKVKLREYEAID